MLCRSGFGEERGIGMADGFGGIDPFWWLRPWSGAFGLAPQDLTQSILPGWSFININETNSGAPDTERRILASDSYGRQLGRLLDAVAALIDERPADARPEPAFTQLAELKERIDGIKADGVSARLQRLVDDLRLLKARDKDAYEAHIQAIQKLIAE
jgi:hypothetical protein